MDNTLLLASGSQARKQLLEGAGIAFSVVKQSADEARCDWGLPLRQLVEQIAIYKMEHVMLPEGSLGDEIFVLTADTLTQDAQGVIHGKPTGRDDEIKKLQANRNGVVTVGTGFCLEKKRYSANGWSTLDRVVNFAQATCTFNIPDRWIARYVTMGLGAGASGGMRVEGYGALFVKSIEGSYTTIVGLPMFELRLALEQLNFFNF